MKEPKFKKILTDLTDHNLEDYINRDDTFEALILRGKFQMQQRERIKSGRCRKREPYTFHKN